MTHAKTCTCADIDRHAPSTTHARPRATQNAYATRNGDPNAMNHAHTRHCDCGICAAVPFERLSPERQAQVDPGDGTWPLPPVAYLTRRGDWLPKMYEHLGAVAYYPKAEYDALHQRCVEAEALRDALWKGTQSLMAALNDVAAMVPDDWDDDGSVDHTVSAVRDVVAERDRLRAELDELKNARLMLGALAKVMGDERDKVRASLGMVVGALQAILAAYAEHYGYRTPDVTDSLDVAIEAARKVVAP